MTYDIYNYLHISYTHNVLKFIFKQVRKNKIISKVEIYKSKYRISSNYVCSSKQNKMKFAVVESARKG